MLAVGSGQQDMCEDLSGGLLVIGRWHGRHQTDKADSKGMNSPRDTDRASGEPALSVAGLMISARRCYR